jgi:hypothetical protein
VFSMFRNKLVYLAVLMALALFSALVAVSTRAQSICDVPGDYGTIQAAVDDAACDTIHLGAGTFYEGVTITRTVTIQGQGTDQTYHEGSGEGSVFFIQESGVVTLTGMTIQNTSTSFAGGILNDGAVTVTNCTLSGNLALFASAIMNRSGTMVVMDSTLRDNSATFYGGSGILNNATLTVINSTLSGNSAFSIGGGIINDGALTVINSTLSGNSAEDGGGISNAGTLTVTNSTFSGNSASRDGGGIVNSESGTLIVTNSILSGNSALRNGGGISNTGTLTVSSSTFSGNSANLGGGIYNGTSGMALVNCILWGNTPDQIAGSGANVTYSDVQGDHAGTGNISADPLFVRVPDPGDGDWTTPGDNDYGDLHLQLTSPAIDAGNNTAMPADTLDLDGDGDTAEPLPFDLDGCFRFVNIPEKPDTGIGPAPIVDMGAYEVQLKSTYLPLVLLSH